VTPPDAKAALREQIRARLKSLTAGERAVAAELIGRRLRAQDFWTRAKTVLLFAPLPDEVNLWPLLEQALAEGKNLTLPRYDPRKKNYAAAQVTDLHRDLVAGVFGIREPAARCREIPLASIDLALVPGVGFDLQGNRLGRGRGFYDRWLTGFGGLKCGLALDEQIADEIPTEEHDLRMDVVLTGTRTISL